MKRDEKSYEVEKLDTIEENKKEKRYSSPNLIDLGKMQRVTLFDKDGSGLDSEAKRTV